MPGPANVGTIPSQGPPRREGGSYVVAIRMKEESPIWNTAYIIDSAACNGSAKSSALPHWSICLLSTEVLRINRTNSGSFSGDEPLTGHVATLPRCD